MPETGLTHVPKQALELIDLLIDFRSEFASIFVYKWIELPRAIRKEYSYSGVVRCRDSSDPQHYHCTFEKQAYFDPSNWVYAMAFAFNDAKTGAGGRLEQRNEGRYRRIHSWLPLLGSEWFTDRNSGFLGKKCGVVGAIFEAFAWHMWQLCDAVSNEGPGVVLKWVNWISDMVAFRQARDTDIGLMVVQEIPTEFEPRCKRNGHLRSVLVC